MTQGLLRKYFVCNQSEDSIVKCQFRHTQSLHLSPKHVQYIFNVVETYEWMNQCQDFTRFNIETRTTIIERRLLQWSV